MAPLAYVPTGILQHWSAFLGWGWDKLTFGQQHRTAQKALLTRWAVQGLLCPLSRQCRRRK